MNDIKVVFGADPEGFYTDGKNVVPPAVYRVDHEYPVTYDENDYGFRHPIFAICEGVGGNIKLIEDGAAFELTVPPSDSMESLFKNINAGYDLAQTVAAQFGDSIAVIPTIPFDVNKFTDRDDEFKECLVFGCDPDQDVFEILGMTEPVEAIEDAMLHPYRYGGGHIHMSGVEMFHQKPLLAVQIMAMTVGNLVTAESTQKELDHLRVYRYGRPGRFRVQEYGKLFSGIPFTDVGIEYRTPSNNWTTSPELARKIEQTVHAVVNKILPFDRIVKEMLDDCLVDSVQAVMKGDSYLAAKTYEIAMSYA